MISPPPYLTLEGHSDVLRLDPARVRIWSGNARVYEALTEETTRDLIESMIAAGGQKVPAVVRAIPDDPDHDYEAVIGTRRHWAVSWLRANGHPDAHFVAQEAVLDDEAAFQLADLENRARKDVTDLERARNYADALTRYYDGHLTGMAQRLKLSKGWLSKTIKIATIPDDVVAAFADPADLQTKPAYALAQALADEVKAEEIHARAKVLAEEQADRRARGDAPLRPAEVMRRLHRDSAPPPPENLPCWRGSNGRPMMSIHKHDKEGLLLRLHGHSGAHAEELVAAFREAIGGVEGISQTPAISDVFPRGNGLGEPAPQSVKPLGASRTPKRAMIDDKSEDQISMF